MHGERLSFLSSRSRRSSPEPPPSAIVAGRVVDATSGRPIAGVIVTPAGSAVVSGPGGERPGASPDQRQRPLRAARSRRRARSSSPRPREATSTPPTASGGRAAARSRSRSTPAQRITDLELRMWKFGRIAGTIARRSGRSRRRHARAGAAEDIRRPDAAGSRRTRTAVTDDRGAYRLAGLTPGDYLVVVPSTQTAVPTDVMESFFTGTPISDAKRVGAGSRDERHRIGDRAGRIAVRDESPAIRRSRCRPAR